MTNTNDNLRDAQYLLDHTLLIRIDENVKVIKKKLDCHSEEIKELNKQNQLRKDWQEDSDTKQKMIIAIASGIGGFLVFIATKMVDWVLKKA